MTVEQWLRGHFIGLGNLIEVDTLRVAAQSPSQAKPTPLRGVDLMENLEDNFYDEEFEKGLDYALSTLYYLMARSALGGSKSERRGNRQVSISGFALTPQQCENYLKDSKDIREALGCEPEKVEIGSSKAFDAAYLTRRSRR